MLLRSIVRAAESKPMDEDIVRKLSQRPGLKYHLYDDIAKMSFTQLLPKPISGLLLLMQDHRHENKKVGHFVLLMRHPRSGITFFDSYGFGLHRLVRLTRNKPHLERILSRIGHQHEVHDNRIKFQHREKDMQTCGRHVICRWNAAALTAKEYAQLMRLPGMNPDEIVTMMTIGSDLAHAIDRHHKNK